MVPLSPCGLLLLGFLLAWTLVLAPCFFFSPFLGCFLFVKFDRVFQLFKVYEHKLGGREGGKLNIIRFRVSGL